MKKWICLLLCVLLLPINALAGANVAYEVFVASFYDGNGDGCGDLSGLTQKLDYIKSLGADSLWLMPVCPSPSYHKYDVTDYFAIDPSYGTLKDFDALAASCDTEGIALIFDLVVNHTSSQHPWFLSAARSLSIPPCGQETCAEKTLCITHNPYVKYYCFNQAQVGHPVPGAQGWYYEGSFGAHMPDLNLDAPAVRQEINNIMAFWLAHGVKGFRLDAVTSYYGGDVVKNTEFLRFLKDAAPDAYFAGEAWTEQNTLLTLYQSGIDSLFNFPFANADGQLISALRKKNGAALSKAVQDWYERLRAVNQNAVDAPFLTNHDMGRVAGVLVRDVKKEKLAAAMYLLLPGRPYVYYGEELGLTGSGRDENKRLPMLWSEQPSAGTCQPPKDSDQEQKQTQGVQEQEQDPDSLLNTYRKLIALRALYPELQTEEITAVPMQNTAIFSYSCGETVQVIHNLSKEATEISLSRAVERLDALGGAIIEGNTLFLQPYESAVLRYEK